MLEHRLILNQSLNNMDRSATGLGWAAVNQLIEHFITRIVAVTPMCMHIGCVQHHISALLQNVPEKRSEDYTTPPGRFINMVILHSEQNELLYLLQIGSLHFVNRKAMWSLQSYT